ncbi:4333_t:CDS:2, partial [Paraglomus occultum]
MYRKPPLFTTITRITVIEDGKTSQSQDYQWDQGEASGSNNSNGNGFDESSEGESPETGTKLAGVKRKLVDEVIVIDGDDENSILSRRSKRLVENDSQ